jgi:hypothetical protein
LGRFVSAGLGPSSTSLRGAKEGFDGTGIQVLDWDHADDTERTHEFVEVLAAVEGIVATVPTTAILGWIGGVLSSALSDAAAGTVKDLINRLRRKQDERQVADFSVIVNGRPLLTVHPNDLGGEVAVTTSDGRIFTTKWSAAAAALQPIRAPGPAPLP